MQLDLFLVRAGEVLGPIADYDVEVGPVAVTVGESSSLRCDLIAPGALTWGDWLQVRLDGADSGRFWHWGPEQTWAGRWVRALDLRSCDGVLELAQTFTPGSLTGKRGDSVIAGQPLVTLAQDICQDLGLAFSAPALDRVAVGDYGWDLGTSFADVISEILTVCGLAWTPGRRGEVFAYRPPTEPAITLESTDIQELSLRPAWERVYNVVVVERRGSAEPAVGVTVYHDDPASHTSIDRFVPRAHVERDIPVEVTSLEALARDRLDQLRIAGGEATMRIPARTDIWPGDRVAVEIDGEMLEIAVTALSWEEGRATMILEGEVERWPGVT